MQGVQTKVYDRSIAGLVQPEHLVGAGEFNLRKDKFKIIKTSMMPGGHWGLGNGEGGLQEHGSLPDGQRLQGTNLIGVQIQRTVAL